MNLNQASNRCKLYSPQQKYTHTARGKRNLINIHFFRSFISFILFVYKCREEKKADTHTFLCKIDCALCIGVYACIRSSQHTNVMHAKDFYSRRKKREKRFKKNRATEV